MHGASPGGLACVRLLTHSHVVSPVGHFTVLSPLCEPRPNLSQSVS